LLERLFAWLNMQKMRLDELLVRHGFFADVGAAERACLAGVVRSGEVLLTQAGTRLAVDAQLSVAEPRRYVSRGGEKLAGALEDFGFMPRGLRCLDVGASSGGFSDCLLQAGARAVTAVDVGYGQFDFRLRGDARVSLFERTNISKVQPNDIGAPFELIVVDVSFSPLARLLPLLEACGSVGSSLIALCKPQFELPKSLVANGVVRDSGAHVQALRHVLRAAGQTNWGVHAIACSHLRGPKGNLEFFLWATLGANHAIIDIERIVREAHLQLGGD
jgi:23S rRNA (cytidine1920-2'-O)/16S rRNA (cytidine1409-2'-O)-methyltransferase